MRFSAATNAASLALNFPVVFCGFRWSVLEPVSLVALRFAAAANALSLADRGLESVNFSLGSALLSSSLFLIASFFAFNLAVFSTFNFSSRACLFSWRNFARSTASCSIFCFLTSDFAKR